MKHWTLAPQQPFIMASILLRAGFMLIAKRERRLGFIFPPVAPVDGNP